MAENITIVGNIASEPRHGVGASGVEYCSFRVAAENRRLDRATGDWVDGEPNWYTVSTFRALAGNAYASLRRGDRIVASGRLRLRDWSDGDRHGTAAEIDADAIGQDLRWGTTTFHRTAGRAGDGAHGDAAVAEERFPTAEDVAAEMQLEGASTPF